MQSGTPFRTSLRAPDNPDKAIASDGDHFSRFGIRFPLLLLAAFLLIVIVGSSVVFQRLELNETRKIGDNLASIARLKAGEIDGWLSQNRKNAEIAGKHSRLSDLSHRWFSSGALTDAESRRLRDRIEQIRRIYAYEEVAILDAEGAVRLSTAGERHDDGHERLLALESARQKRAMTGHPHRLSRPDGTPYVSLPIAAPLISAEEGGKVAGVLLIEIDVSHHLFPLVASWPVASESAEIQLFRVEGDELLALNDFRFLEGTALNTRIPASHPTILAAMAAHGSTGLMTGTDYRGAPVVGRAVNVPGTDWLMIAKIDEEEAYGPIRKLLWTSTGLRLAVVVVTGLLLFFWWRQKMTQWERSRAQHLAARLEAELNRQRLAGQFDYLTRYANDIILLLDEAGTIVEANERAEAAYGYSRQELLGMNVRRLRLADDMAEVESRFASVRNSDAVVFEDEHVRKDGTTFPAEVNSRVIRTDNGLYVQSIIRVITERMAAEERERRLTDIYGALVQTNEAIFRLESEAELMREVCRIAVDKGRMMLAWVGIPDGQGRLVPAASCGEAVSYLDEISVSILPDVTEGQGPSGIAFREYRPVVANEFLSDEKTGRWFEPAQRYGIGAGAAFPVVRGGRPYAVLAVYTRRADVFDDRIVQLLTEMAANVGFALDSLDREAARRKAESDLRESEKRYRTLFENSPDGIFLTDTDGTIIEANPTACNMLGMNQIEIIARGRTGIIEDSTALRLGLQARARFRRATAELNFIRKDGTRFPVEVGSVVLEDTPELRAIVIARDISEHKRREEELKLAAAVYRDSSEAMMVTDENRDIIAVNQAFTDMTGYGPEEALGRNPRFLKSGHHDEDFYRDMHEQLRTEGRFKSEIWNRKRNGELFAAHLTINAVAGEEGRPHRYVGLMSDITEKKRSDERIWQQANFDALTGLPNRRFFRDRLQLEVRNTRRNLLPFALMFLDLDGFKDVNDTLGHDMGDLLLKVAAERLRKCVRETDSVARLGGDEFTVILTELHDSGSVDRIARHVLRSLSEPVMLGGETAYVSASIGITLFPDDASDAEDLIRNADQAMYAAKQQGKNRYHYFTPSMQEDALKRMRMINDMRGALVGRQFEIVYQPIVELASGEIVKAEALIRWQHPTKGLINPIEFISAAEDTGMITSFGNWIFREAASRAAQWRNLYHAAFQISVNVSPVQFRNAGIDPSIWFEHLRELGMPGQGIVVEITEGLLLDANAKVADQLLMLRDAGIEVALDDFGTGYSAMSYLQKFDIDYIKIDRELIHELAAGSDAMVLCEAMIAMAHKMDVKVIAEGVETVLQHELLANGGCDFSQGYYFSPPVAADAFEALLRAKPFLYQERFDI